MAKLWLILRTALAAMTVLATTFTGSTHSVAPTETALAGGAQVEVSAEEEPGSKQSGNDQVVLNERVEVAVREYFADIPVMIKIAWCESKFTHYTQDGSVLRGRVVSSDLGVMQVNEYYHGDTAAALGLDLLDLGDNMAYSRHLYEKQGTRPWKASQSCWQGGSAHLAVQL